MQTRNYSNENTKMQDKRAVKLVILHTIRRAEPETQLPCTLFAEQNQKTNIFSKMTLIIIFQTEIIDIWKLKIELTWNSD